MFSSCVTVAENRFPDLSQKDRETVARLAAEIRRSEPKIDRIEPFGKRVRIGCGPGPKILFGDAREIPLLAAFGATRLDYRIGFLASEGDLVVTGGQGNPDFEAYQREILGIERLAYFALDLDADPRLRASTVACMREDEPFGRLRDFVTKNGGATLLAHFTSGTIWALAARLGRKTGKRVHVAGPPPLLSRLANDKLWFGRLAAQALGPETVPEKRTANAVSSIVRHVSELAKKRDRLVLKIPDSAGSAGNFIVDASAIRGLGAKAVASYLRENIRIPGWAGQYPIAVEVWDANVLSSPSVQIWIPKSSDGLPVVEGIFEQILSGAEGTFVGAVIADLPVALDRELVRQSAILAQIFQQLGYYGRCSFDAILAGADMDAARVLWIECNARWGGVSIPMSFVNARAEAQSYAIVQTSDIEMQPRRFGDVLRGFEDLRPDPGLRTGVVFLSPDSIERGTGAHFLSLGASRKDTDVQTRDVLRRLGAL